MAEPVRRLSEAGIGAFRRYLAELRQGATAPPPTVLLTDPDFSEPLERETTVEERQFGNRLEAARYLDEALRPLGSVDQDVGLWSWLSLFYFDQVCPPAPDGRRSPGRDYRHILEPGYLHGHRHLLAGPLIVYRLHGENARLLLCTKVHVENAFHHELSSRQAFLSNPAVMAAAHMLYLNSRNRRPKRGAQDPKRSPGSLRRFVDVVQQLDLNYDLYSMEPEAILDLLPDEFRRWMPLRRRLGLRRRRSA